jgi:CDP-4-dehydro-6-deoxyglucose reductase/3-phenylpropionate/trans-cinnamate dioxygenase ferredoxin reductase subunit
MTSMINIAQRDIVFPCGPDERILDAAERAGYVVPYGCRKGVCGTCRGKLTKGSVKVAPSGSHRVAGEDILYCMAVPQGSVELAPAWIEKRAPPVRSIVETVVHRMVWKSPEVVALQLRLPIGRRIHFRPGQYVRAIMADETSRNYSIANPPQLNDILDLHVRRIPGGRFSDHFIGTLTVGSVIKIDLPYGLFSWSEDVTRPAILLATGTGFAPLKSMIEDIIRRGVTKPLHLFWGGERECDLYDRALVQAWTRRHSWIDFTPVLAKPDADWTGSRGYVQEAALARHPDLSDSEVYACGNPVMIGAARTLLARDGGLRAGSFRSDAFVPSGEIEPARRGDAVLVVDNPEMARS